MSGSDRRLGRVLGRASVRAGALASAAVTAHLAVNLTQARQPVRPRIPVAERVSVLIPARDEAHRIGPTLTALLRQECLADVEFIVLDDGSADDTADRVRAIAGDDPRVRLIHGGDEPPPDGWLGKPWACHRLASQATGSVLVFLDADVTLEPWAIASCVQLMRELGHQLVSPWPRQVCDSPAERVTQPLLNWAWLSLMPMWLAMRSSNPLWSLANGQFLVFDAQAYRASGGHAAVCGKVIEDVTIMANLKRHGYLSTPVIGAEIASCRMYTSAREVYEGYSKNLWSLFPSKAPAITVAGLATLVYFVPPAAALVSRDPSVRRWGALGYASAALGRVVIARRVGEPAFPDAFAHPLSIMAFLGILGASIARHDRGTLRWKGRPVEATALPAAAAAAAAAPATAHRAR
ncbi:MAG: glycosyltransferase [Actinomycetales bacterium]|nr:glycosyltransferase [Actinomycetales bacterium]